MAHEYLSVLSWIMDAYRTAFGQAVRVRRLERGLSQEALGARSGIHRTYIASVERGERNLGYANLLKIAAALELSGADLVRAAERGRGTRRRR